MIQRLMKLHKKQKEIVRSGARFKVTRAGRRSGKSTGEIEIMLHKATGGKDRNVFYIAPTQKQARSIIWEALKSRIGTIGDANESRLEMKVPTVDGGFSTIFIAGWENRENFRGMKAYHITFDELDTMKDFFIGWQEIFRPALIDSRGTADFIGTPKKENPNLRRLEKEARDDKDWDMFHFTTSDNPHIPRDEIEKARESLDHDTYQQEIMAEYIDNEGALFRYTSLLDMFTNTPEESKQRYLIIDIAGDGSDKTEFAFWQGLDCYRIDEFQGITTEVIISKTREYAKEHHIPYSHIAVDAIGIGEGVASSSLLSGIIGFKSSYQAIKTDASPVRLPNVHYTNEATLVSEYRNLRSQCIFTLANLINNHKIGVSVDNLKLKENIIEELGLYQDVSDGDGKRMATKKDDIKALLGRSPDVSDTMIMRMYFVIREIMLPDHSEKKITIKQGLDAQFNKNRHNNKVSSSQ